MHILHRIIISINIYKTPNIYREKRTGILERIITIKN
jgi:hypothetical protein